MIVGVGIDLIEVARVATSVARENGFKERIFSLAEIAYCEERKEKAQHYAARFAAKEAFLKATGKGLGLGYQLHEIEIVHEADGRPTIQLHGAMKENAQRYGWAKMQVSLTHLKDMASAIVIIEAE
jgi:holo-[acyl-carrier protein] synthase